MHIHIKHVMILQPYNCAQCMNKSTAHIHTTLVYPTDASTVAAVVVVMIVAAATAYSHVHFFGGWGYCQTHTHTHLSAYYHLYTAYLCKKKIVKKNTPFDIGLSTVLIAPLVDSIEFS